MPLTKRTRSAKSSGLKITEAQLEKTGSDFLALDGWRGLKTDPVSRREWGKGFGELGMADHLYLRYNYLSKDLPRNDLFRSLGEILWIEWKNKDGKAQQHQLEWAVIERARGGMVWLAGYDFDAVFKAFTGFYKRSGLCRRMR